MRLEMLTLFKLVGPYLLGFTVIAFIFLLILMVFAGAPWKTAIFVFPFVIIWGSIAGLLGLRSAGGGG